MKRLCVLQVTPTAPTPDHVAFFAEKEDCDFYFVTHDAPHPDALKYCPNTTWVDTRNILAEMVPKEYEYYAFVDYDFKFYPQGHLGVREQVIADLAKFEPAVLTYYPGPGFITPFNSDKEYFNKHDYSVIPFTHCGMKVIHHSLLDWFFPMLTRFGGGVEACHMFNIQEIPFLNHVVCSHQMIYDNEVTDMETPHNVDGAWSKYRMDQSWEWLSTAFKKNSILRGRLSPEEGSMFRWDAETASFVPNGGDPRARLDSLNIKETFISIFKRLDSTLQKSSKNVQYYNEEKIKKFFDLDHEMFNNKHLSLTDQLTSLEKGFVSRVEEVLRQEVTFKTLKVRSNPWIEIVKKVNDTFPDHRNITITECVEIFQKMKDNSAIFYKNSKPDATLEEYLAGKRVALVGPAPYLIGQNRGRVIDDYDVVVRIQPEIFCPEDYGSRTDIVQSCMNSSYSPKIAAYLEKIPPQQYPKFIISNNTVARETSPGSKIWSDVVEEYDTYLKQYGVPFSHFKTGGRNVRSLGSLLGNIC